MKNSIFKSFRFEIVLYSLLSLVYAFLTEAALFSGIYLIYHILNSDKTDILNSDNLNNSIDNSAALKRNVVYGMQSGTSLQGTKSPGLGFIIVLVILAVIIGIVLFTTYFLLLSKKFVTYLEEIAEGITEMSSGNFDARIAIKNEDEFAFLATKLNHMADDIKQIIENNSNLEQTKNQLITSVAHDLRTPLTSIIGYLDLVSEENKLTADVQQRYIKIAYSKSKRLEKLIEDLFTYTNFTFGEVTMECSDIDMVKFIEQLVEEFYPSFQESGLEYDFSTNLTSAIVIADGNLLARAFANLISNAIKYGRDGKIVKLRMTKENGKVIITSTNYGILIPEKDLNNIFDRFYRVEDSRSSETGGTGLGLAIAKSIIQMHGGTIVARSGFDGTVFEVVLNEKKEGIS